jgi:hypothetical protein
MLIPARRGPAHHDGLQQSDRFNRRSELRQRVLIERLPGLTRIRRDRVHGDFFEVRTGNFGRSVGVA